MPHPALARGSLAEGRIHASARGGAEPNQRIRLVVNVVKSRPSSRTKSGKHHEFSKRSGLVAPLAALKTYSMPGYALRSHNRPYGLVTRALTDVNAPLWLRMPTEATGVLGEMIS